MITKQVCMMTNASMITLNVNFNLRIFEYIFENLYEIYFYYVAKTEKNPTRSKIYFLKIKIQFYCIQLQLHAYLSFTLIIFFPERRSYGE